MLDLVPDLCLIWFWCQSIILVLLPVVWVLDVLGHGLLVLNACGPGLGGFSPRSSEDGGPPADPHLSVLLP